MEEIDGELYCPSCVEEIEKPPESEDGYISNKQGLILSSSGQVASSPHRPI
jgi:hypothetical protein